MSESHLPIDEICPSVEDCEFCRFPHIEPVPRGEWLYHLVQRERKLADPDYDPLNPLKKEKPDPDDRLGAREKA